VNRSSLSMADVYKLVQQNLVGSVHASITLVFMEVLGLALQRVVVLNMSSLGLDLLFKGAFVLYASQLFLVILVAFVTVAQHIDVVLNVSRSYHIV